MRPNIEISHRLNGEVKDYAARHDMSAGDAYQRVIETGLEALEVQDAAPDWDYLSEQYGLDDDERAAVQAIHQIVAEHHPGWAQKQDIIARAHEEYPADKDTDWWWRQLVTECLVDAGVIEKREGGLVRLAE